MIVTFNEEKDSSLFANPPVGLTAPYIVIINELDFDNKLARFIDDG